MLADVKHCQCPSVTEKKNRRSLSLTQSRFEIFCCCLSPRCIPWAISDLCPARGCLLPACQRRLCLEASGHRRRSSLVHPIISGLTPLLPGCPLGPHVAVPLGSAKPPARPGVGAPWDRERIGLCEQCSGGSRFSGACGARRAAGAGSLVSPELAAQLLPGARCSAPTLVSCLKKRCVISVPGQELSFCLTGVLWQKCSRSLWSVLNTAVGRQESEHWESSRISPGSCLLWPP